MSQPENYIRIGETYVTTGPLAVLAMASVVASIFGLGVLLVVYL